MQLEPENNKFHLRCQKNRPMINAKIREGSSIGLYISSIVIYRSINRVADFWAYKPGVFLLLFYWVLLWNSAFILVLLSRFFRELALRALRTRFLQLRQFYSEITQASSVYFQYIWPKWVYSVGGGSKACTIGDKVHDLNVIRIHRQQLKLYLTFIAKTTITWLCDELWSWNLICR